MRKRIRFASVVVAGLLAGMLASEGQQVRPEIGFVKGISWGWLGHRGEYEGPAAAESMRKLAKTGADWVCIVFATNMTAPDDPDFTWGADNPRMVSDDEVRRAIDLARENKLKVILKPVVNCADGTWRGWIRFYRPLTDREKQAGTVGEFDPWGKKPRMRVGEVTDTDAWQAWWSNYADFILHYAALAQEKNVELFCLGCEMNSTETHVDEWRQLIRQVRAEYAGPLVYDINHGRESALGWWDAVDVIGISAYYEVPPQHGETASQSAKETTPQAEIKSRLEGVRDALAAVSKKHNKPILFIETGVTNVRGAAHYPWSHPLENPDCPLDEVEQANYYRAFFEVFWNEPWFKGFAWWDWPAKLYPVEEATKNRSFCIYGKQAERVLRDWYSQPRP